jgi:hypothetical protein
MLSAVALFAALYGDTPDDKHAWSVHDWNRPKPAKVTPAAKLGEAPSDAVVLFDGTRESFERNWCDKNGKASKWSYSPEGYFYTVPGWKLNGGDIFTRGEFGDCQLHIEYRHDPNQLYSDKGPQMRGNSGIFLMGNYEIQVLDSYETDPSKDPNPNPNYADGQASAVYAENPPLVNACRGPGEWQTYDIVFHQPVWKDGKMIHPGSITVFHNGVLTQDHWEMEGLTTHQRRRPLAPHATRLPLRFQDHGNPVRFRNVWIRDIPSRYANTTHGGPGVKEADVMALRAKTAAKLFEKVDTSKHDGETVSKILEVVSYCKDDKYLSFCKKAVAGYIADLDKLDAKGIDAKKGEILRLKKETDVLLRNKVMDKCCLNAKLVQIAKSKKWIR